MKKKKGITIKSTHILAGITVFCMLIILLSLVSDFSLGPLKTVSSFTVVPIQKGINNIGVWLSEKGEYFKSLDSLIKENEELKTQNEELTLSNNQLIQDTYKVEQYEALFELSETYSSYDKVAARVISGAPDNWSKSFVIDKGSDSGIQVDMNVIATGGLVGIVTDVTPTSATVRPIIDDKSSVTGKISSTSDSCIVTGDIRLLDEGTLYLQKLSDLDNKVVIGDIVVTSHLSDKYLEGIIIGYVSELTADANNLTKSGYIYPAVDFKHLEEVMVILQLKEGGQASESKDESDSDETTGAETTEDSNEPDSEMKEE